MNNFIGKFNEWLKDKSFNFNPIVVNKKFKELNLPYNPEQQKDFLDYNHCVDDILQISPPYNYCNDKKAKHDKNPKAFESLANLGSQIQASQLLSSQFTNTQKSIVPSRKKIQTIKFDASPQRIQWQIPDDREMDDIEKSLNMNGPITRMAKKKSSTFSVTDIKNTTQKQIDNEDLFNKTSTPALNPNMSQIYNMYNLQNNDEQDGTNPYDISIENLFQNPSQTNNMLLRSNSKITRSIPRRPNVGIGKSLSGFSNFSANNEAPNEKREDENGTNLFNQLHGSLNGAPGSGYLKIQATDMNRFDMIDENQIGNLPELPNLSSRNNSIQQIYRNDSTPALLRGGSSIIDSKILRK